MGDQGIGYGNGHVAGNGKPDAFEPAGLGDYRRIDADDLSLKRQQGTSAIAGVNRGIRLEKILISARVANACPMLGADDPLGHGFVQTPFWPMATTHCPTFT